MRMMKKERNLSNVLGKPASVVKQLKYITNKSLYIVPIPAPFGIYCENPLPTLSNRKPLLRESHVSGWLGADVLIATAVWTEEASLLASQSKVTYSSPFLNPGTTLLRRPPRK